MLGRKPVEKNEHRYVDETAARPDQCSDNPDQDPGKQND